MKSDAIDTATVGSPCLSFSIHPGASLPGQACREGASSREREGAIELIRRRPLAFGLRDVVRARALYSALRAVAPHAKLESRQYGPRFVVHSLRAPEPTAEQHLVVIALLAFFTDLALAHQKPAFPTKTSQSEEINMPEPFQ